MRISKSLLIVIGGFLATTQLDAKVVHFRSQRNWYSDCLGSVHRFVVDRHAEVTGGIASIDPNWTLKGVDSGITYQSFFSYIPSETFQEVSRRDAISFSFRQLGETGRNFQPSIYLRLPVEPQLEKNWLLLNLQRDPNTGSFLDLNLYRSTMNYLRSRLQIGETLNFYVTDPEVVKQLRNELNEVFIESQIEPEVDKAIAAPEGDDEMSELFDSLIPRVDGDHGYKIVHELENQHSLGRKLRQAFIASRLGAPLIKDGGWEIAVDLEYQEVETPASMLLEEESNLRQNISFAFRFRVELRAIDHK